MEEKVELFTLGIVKPKATENHLGQILEEITRNGLTIRKLETRLLKKEEAESLYIDHKGKEFYEPLIEYMTSSPVVLMKLQNLKCSDIVGFWRLCIGDSDCNNASKATIRSRFGNPEVMRENAVHGSDSVESAARELEIFFPIDKT